MAQRIEKPVRRRVARTADLVIVGLTEAGGAAAIHAARLGRRVLIVDESTDRRACRRLRRSLRAAGEGGRRRVSVLTGVAVKWIDGAGIVEVVLLRHVRTGRLIGINTGAVLVTKALAASVIAPQRGASVRDASP